MSKLAEKTVVVKDGEHHDENCDCGHEHHHHHDENCDCGHEHHHHHDENCDCGHEHHHHHDENCDCGHEHHHHHDENCDCGHEHHHHHDENCDCGHEHHHHHDENCDCGHEHHHHHDSESHTKLKGGKQKVYTLQNLGCAHCAAEMEYQISRLEGVSDCVLVYETKQLRITGSDPDSLLPEIRRICSSIESTTKVIAPEDEETEESSPVWELIAGSACFLLGLFIPGGVIKTVCFAVAYVLLGWRVLFTAIRNLLKGRIFDENFLMSLATLGAIGIKEYSEAVGVMLFYRVGEYFEDKAVEKSRRQIMDAVDLRPETVILDDGREIPAEKAEAGDIIIVRPGDRIPLDGIVIEGESRLDTSAVTGEPVPLRVSKGDEIMSGCVNTDGVMKLKATKPLSESMVQRILDSVENAAARKPKLDRFITRFSKVYTPAVVAAACLTFLVPGLITGDWGKWLYTALTFLVISCPCALVLSVPLSYFAGIGSGSKKGILFKGGSSIEMLEQVKAVVMDKTGTITKGDFSVKKAIPHERLTEDALLSLAAGCESASTHPIAKSITQAAKDRQLSEIEISNVKEVAGEGIEAVFEGKPVLCGSQKLLKRNGVSLNGYENEKGSTEVLLSLDGKFIGHIVISDTLKPKAKEAISRLRKLGLKTAMLTGDSPESAKLVSKEAGLDEVYAKLLPNEKLETLLSLREKYGKAMFVGDGINDAPVLAGADVGAAMGSGADAAIEAADIVFMNPELSSIPEALDISRKTGRIAKQNIIFALTVKALVLVLGLMGYASMWLAVFADSGVAMLCVLNSVRILAN